MSKTLSYSGAVEPQSTTNLLSGNKDEIRVEEVDETNNLRRSQVLGGSIIHSMTHSFVGD
jgi:hypothetical protein